MWKEEEEPPSPSSLVRHTGRRPLLSLSLPRCSFALRWNEAFLSKVGRAVAARTSLS